MNINYHIVIAGGSSYMPSIEYLQTLYRIISNKDAINVWCSLTTFNQYPTLMSELQENCKRLNLKLHSFGDFDPQSHLGGQILNSIRMGLPLEEFSPGAKLRMRKELNENINL